jgi:hypothetical protein
VDKVAAKYNEEIEILIVAAEPSMAISREGCMMSELVLNLDIKMPFGPTGLLWLCTTPPQIKCGGEVVFPGPHDRE